VNGGETIVSCELTPFAAEACYQGRAGDSHPGGSQAGVSPTTSDPGRGHRTGSNRSTGATLPRPTGLAGLNPPPRVGGPCGAARRARRAPAARCSLWSYLAFGHRRRILAACRRSDASAARCAALGVRWRSPGGCPSGCDKRNSAARRVSLAGADAGSLRGCGAVAPHPRQGWGVASALASSSAVPVYQVVRIDQAVPV
jgi:hypothetical protein